MSMYLYTGARHTSIAYSYIKYVRNALFDSKLTSYCSKINHMKTLPTQNSLYTFQRDITIFLSKRSANNL